MKTRPTGTLWSVCSPCSERKFIKCDTYSTLTIIIIYIRLHNSEMRGKAISYSLLQKVFWPSKSDTNGINNMLHVLHGKMSSLIRRGKKAVRHV